MRSKILSFILLTVLLAATACTPQAAPAAPTAAPAATQVPPTQAPPPAAVPPTGASAPTAVPPRTLTVLAAASLTESFTELGKTFEAQNPGVTVAFSFAGSQQLAQQLDQGAGADLFASASKKYMDAAVTSKRVVKYDPKTFVSNRLVVIFPKDNPAGLKELKDLAKPGLKLDLADKTVPVGQYALDFLDKAVADTTNFEPAFKDSVLKNVVSYETDVKAVVSKVALGEADAGIVYVTDYNAAADKLGKLNIPDALNTVATYPIAAISDSKNPDLAGAFVSLVLSPDGQQTMAKYGFIPAVTGAATSGGYLVTDALGRAVRFDKPPERIVLVGKALFMVADAIYLFPEAGQRIVAIGSTVQGNGNFIPMIDPTFNDKIALDSSAGPEQIAAANPDCVIMKSSNASTLGKALEPLKIPVVYLDFETPEQYQRDLKTLGQLFQNPDQAAKLAAYYKGKAEAVAKPVSGLADEQKPKTLVLYYSEKDGAVAFNVPPMGWMQTLQVLTAGGAPVWTDANPGSGWTKVNFEQVAAWDPEVIFVVAYTSPINDVVAKLKADTQWQNLKAVKNNKVYGFVKDVYSWDQPDTRWTLGLAWVAGKLHPDLFPGLDITREAQAFYQDLYGMDQASFQQNIQPILTGDLK
jgi:molybdenum ABC transporter molybdate-binding protein